MMSTENRVLQKLSELLSEDSSNKTWTQLLEQYYKLHYIAQELMWLEIWNDEEGRKVVDPVKMEINVKYRNGVEKMERIHEQLSNGVKERILDNGSTLIDKLMHIEGILNDLILNIVNVGLDSLSLLLETDWYEGTKSKEDVVIEKSLYLMFRAMEIGDAELAGYMIRVTRPDFLDDGDLIAAMEKILNQEGKTRVLDIFHNIEAQRISRDTPKSTSDIKIPRKGDLITQREIIGIAQKLIEKINTQEVPTKKVHVDQKTILQIKTQEYKKWQKNRLIRID